MNRKRLGYALERALTGLLEQRRKQPRPCGAVEIPLIGAVAIYTDAGVEEAAYAIVDAMNRQAQWDREKPLPWLPSLPLDELNIREMLNTTIREGEDGWRLYLGSYAWSLRQAWWDPDHPGFKEFIAGMLSSPKCPGVLQVNPILLDKFRCQPLPGFNDETMCWERRLMPKSEGIPAKAPPAGPARAETGLAR
jgi:hypothetical protein